MGRFNEGNLQRPVTMFPTTQRMEYIDVSAIVGQSRQKMFKYDTKIKQSVKFD